MGRVHSAEGPTTGPERSLRTVVSVRSTALVIRSLLAPLLSVATRFSPDFSPPLCFYLQVWSVSALTVSC